MSWDLNSTEPIYLQLVKEIELRIITGIYPVGSQLPGVRVMAQDAAVNPNTMQKALQELERKELVYTQRTSGRFVTDDMNIIENAKMRIATDYITDFLDGMQKLGISKYDAAALINKAAKEE